MADTLTGGADVGADTVAGGQGADLMVVDAGLGNDLLNDTLVAGGSNDSGNDLLNDTLVAGGSNDSIIGGAGNDAVVVDMDVGAGNDALVVDAAPDLEDAPADPDAVSAAPPRAHQALVEQFAMKWHEVKVFAEHLTGDLDGELGEVLALARKA